MKRTNAEPDKNSAFVNNLTDKIIMEVKSRPIPVTILDFMAILLPGLVWELLFFITFQLASGQSSFINSPIIGLKSILPEKSSEFSWTPVLLLIAGVALVIGYVVKPIATQLTQILTAILFKFRKKHKEVSLKDWRFPFNHYFKDDKYQKDVSKFIYDKFGCEASELPGQQPFSTAKRYIRLKSPVMWEECERMEAEVRMVGALFLATIYNLLLCLIILLSKATLGCCSDVHYRSIWIWLIVSVVIGLFLAEIFNLLRIREVKYVYLNTLIIRKFGTLTEVDAEQSKIVSEQ